MTPDLNRLYVGDCLEVMKAWPADFIDTVITDPPYGLEFMGKDWDGDVPGVHFWAEMLRVAKPGAMLLSFGGTRTWHHLAMAIEKAGWQIRDCLMWLYGSGFPKSLDISKAIDKAKGAERTEIIGEGGQPCGGMGINAFGHWDKQTSNPIFAPATATATATAWKGYGTALKPAWEPILLAMKPTDGTFAENAEKWGVAGLNVDGARIGFSASEPYDLNGKVRPNVAGKDGIYGGSCVPQAGWKPQNGRWPANLILDEAAAGMVDGASGAWRTAPHGGGTKAGGIFGVGHAGGNHSDFGGASRFFYIAKADRRERNEGCEEISAKAIDRYGECGQGSTPQQTPRKTWVESNNHPTVKPLDLMKYLCNLTRTPTGGIVLDPFAGSGTTLWAAECHNRPWIGIEMNPEYAAIAEARLARERSQMKMAI